MFLKNLKCLIMIFIFVNLVCLKYSYRNQDNSKT